MSGRLLRLALAVASLAGCAPVRPPPAAPAAATRVAVYVGTYTGHGARGIYRLEFDTASGAWSDPVLAGESENASFLALHPNGRVLYAVNELETFGASATGAVSAFEIDPTSGSLTLLGQQASGGRDPCHLVVDRSGRNVLVANYTGGSVSVLPIDAGGGLQPVSIVVQHEGAGPDRARQAGPHAHAVVLDGAEHFALVADLGADRILVYRFDADGGSLEPNDLQSAALEPGSGPRHLAWHPSGRYLYAINELRSTITAFRYDPARGAAAAFQTVTTLPDGFSGENRAAEVVVSADGRFLYGSNRGNESIAIFMVDEATGALVPVGHVPAGGRTPRHIALDPSGRWLIAANQDSDSIATFRRDPLTGRLDQVGRPQPLSKPVCILFAPLR